MKKLKIMLFINKILKYFCYIDKFLYLFQLLIDLLLNLYHIFPFFIYIEFNIHPLLNNI